jgi:hypothetical protein
MPEQSEPESARTSRTQQELQSGSDEIATKIVKELERSQAERERLRAEAMASDLEILREALRCVRRVTCEALADAAPERTIMVVKEERNGDIIACCPVSDAVANNYDKTRSIHEQSKEYLLSVDFVRVQCKTLSSAEACKKFLRHLNGDDDAPFTVTGRNSFRRSEQFFSD